MTTNVYIFLAQGFETIEALAVADILKRGAINVKLVSISDSLYVESAQNIVVKADVLFSDTNFNDATMLLLPGGMPGASNLNNHEGLQQLLLKHNAEGKKIGAICAAPMVLGNLGLLKGKQATCYPGFDKYLAQAHYTAQFVTTDGNITTGKGPAATLDYAYTILSILAGKDKANEIKKGMLYNEKG